MAGVGVGGWGGCFPKRFQGEGAGRWALPLGTWCWHRPTRDLVPGLGARRQGSKRVLTRILRVRILSFGKNSPLPRHGCPHRLVCRMPGPATRQAESPVTFGPSLRDLFLSFIIQFTYSYLKPDSVGGARQRASPGPVPAAATARAAGPGSASRRPSRLRTRWGLRWPRVIQQRLSRAHWLAVAADASFKL